MGQIAPVVPPHQGGVKYTQEIQVPARKNKDLVIGEHPRSIQQVARMELDFLIHHLRLIERLPMRKTRQLPPEPYLVFSFGELLSVLQEVFVECRIGPFEYVLRSSCRPRPGPFVVTTRGHFNQPLTSPLPLPAVYILPS